MKHIPLLFVLATIGTVSCATPTEELITEAKECVNTSANELGVIGASKEQKTACWAAANSRIAAVAKRELERDIELATACPMGQVKVCQVYSRSDKRCACIRDYDLNRVLGGRY